MDPVSSVSNNGSTPVAAPAPASPSTTGSTVSASTLAQLQTEEGVVVSLGGQNASSTNSPIDLYTQLAQLGSQLTTQQTAAPAPAPAPAANTADTSSTSSSGSSSATSGTGDTGTDNTTSNTAASSTPTTTSSTSNSAQPPNVNGVIDLNSEWANVLKTRPELATQAVQVESDQVLLSKTL